MTSFNFNNSYINLLFLRTVLYKFTNKCRLQQTSATPKHVVAAEHLYGQQTNELPKPYQHMHSPRFTTTVAADR